MSRTIAVTAAIAAFAAVAAFAGTATPARASEAAATAAVTVSPLPGTRDASPSTQISFLGPTANEIHGVSAIGSRSGVHYGAISAYTSAPGASFLPSKRFAEGERVRVSATIGVSGHTSRVTTSFTVAQHDYAFHFGRPSTPPPPKPGSYQQFVSAPSLKPPPVEIEQSSAQAAAGDIFLAPRHSTAQDGPMIVDGSGNMVWFKPLPAAEGAMDMKATVYEGRPVLVWWQGGNAPLSELGLGFGMDEVYDTSYRPVAQIRAGNGYWADLHEVKITPQGSAFITADTLVRANLASVHGQRNGAIADGVVQEIDIKTGLVMFEWHAWGHVALNNSYARVPMTTTRPWDWIHLNSISLGPYHDMLISARNTWSVYDVSLADGRVQWRLGGKKPTFHMGPGTITAWQHSAHWQPDHTITIFDDGATPKVHSQSRAIREQIDWSTRTISLVTADEHNPPLLAGSQGNDQVLPNGDSFVGWGSEPYFTEFDPSGRVVFDGRLQPPAQSYRAYKLPWSATPAYPPSISVKPAGSTGTTVYASWNGATDVASWRVLAGPSAAQLTPLQTAAKSGFETAIALTGSTAWFAVQAIDASGRVLGQSHAVRR